ncbi:MULTISPECIES: DUF6159 family protein [Salinibaculum]|uniref:DUF6159 family protein n=1 Tax=Salinibaculum TaxID=2732368 RepID=UPI0030D00C72
MGLFGRLRRGLALTKDSIGVLRHNPSLLSFPLVGGASALVFLAVLLGTTYGVIGVPEDEVVAVGLLFAVYFVSTFVTSFFTAALVSETRQAFDGRPPDFGRGLAAAWRVKGKLVVWAVIAATIGVVIRVVESSDSRIARVFAWVFSAAWSVLTFFVVPVAVLEPDVGLTGMFRRSGSTFRETWGESAIGMVGPGVIAFLVFLVGAGVGFGIFTATGSAIAAGAVVAVFVVLGLLVAATTKGIIKTSLYVYATEGKRPSEFASRDFERLGE